MSEEYYVIRSYYASVYQWEVDHPTDVDPIGPYSLAVAMRTAESIHLAGEYDGVRVEDDFGDVRMQWGLT